MTMLDGSEELAKLLPKELPTKFIESAQLYFEAGIVARKFLDEKLHSYGNVGPDVYLLVHAAELCLKAVLLENGWEIEELGEIGHSLEKLLNECRRLEPFDDKMTTFNIYVLLSMGRGQLASTSRYPDRQVYGPRPTRPILEETVKLLLCVSKGLVPEFKIPGSKNVHNVTAGKLSQRPSVQPSVRKLQN